MVTFFVQAKKVTRPPGMAGEAQQGRTPRQCAAPNSEVTGFPLSRGRRNWVRVLFVSAAGTAALCFSRAPLGRGEQAEEKSRSDRRQDAGEFAVSTRTCCRRTPQPAREVCRARMPGKPRPRGCPSLWLLSLGQARESDWPPGMADIPHTDVSRSSRSVEGISRKLTARSKWIPAFAGMTTAMNTIPTQPSP